MKTPYDSIVKAAADKHGMPPDLLWGQIMHESSFNPRARSTNKDAHGNVLSVDRGIAQINSVAHPDISDVEADNPEWAINWMAQTMAANFKRYQSWPHALVAYNAGHWGPDTEWDIGYSDAVYKAAKLSPFYQKGAESMTYPKVQAQVDGEDVLAVAVGNRTYLNWTVARDSGCNITHVAVGDVEINGHKPPQVNDDVSTYLDWASIPSIDPNPVKDASGVWQFSTKHAYTWTVTETPSAVVGEWATLEIQTLDNGQPLGKQIIQIFENGQRVVNDYTDDDGKYVYRIIETSGKTDTMTVTWKDPAEQSHSTTHSTVFTAPQATPTPIPPDMKIVAQFPILPTSDAMNAVYFDMSAPNGQTIQCQLDTGAFELMFTSVAASILGLKNERNITIGGIGGTTPAYDSHATFKIGAVEFTSIPCTVAPSFSGFPLFGYKFFIDNNYDLQVSHIHHTVTILTKAAA